MKAFVPLIVGCVLLVWSGLAMANGNNFLNDAAKECDEDGDYTQLISVFPYFPAEADGFVSGMALMNKHDEQTIFIDDLCFVSVDSQSKISTAKNTQAIFPRNIKAYPVAELPGFTKTWAERMYLAIYAHKNASKAADADFLRSFGMIGDGQQAQGYFAVTNGAFEKLEFDYMPGDAWTRGFALINTSNTDVVVEFVAYEADGNPEEISYELDAGEMLATSPDVLFVEKGESLLDPAKRVLIVATAYETDDLKTKVDCLYGFAMFGDGIQAQGYLPVGHD
jgi:hypothetical protein